MKCPPSDTIWPLLIMGVLFFVSGQTHVAAPSFSFSPDKIAHLIVFGMLGTSLIRLPCFRDRGWSGALAAASLATLYGVMDEIRQSFTPGRSVEMLDAIADALGAFIAVFLYQGFEGYRAFLEWSKKSSA